MPWQQHVADVIMEVDPVTGRLVYDEWRLTVPRQSGKSTFVLAKATHRSTATGFFGPRQTLLYTAQNRKAARKKWEKDYAFSLRRSRTWGRDVSVHLSNGNEHLLFPNGSTFGPESNTEKAGHGDTLDEAYIDEAFAQVDTRLEQAFGPAMITRANKQLGVISTAGWLDGSPYLLEKVKTGRDLVELGVREGTAYFEWSAADDADPEDPATWWSCMPALGLTISEEAIASEFRKRDLNDFSRAYLNRWVFKDAPEDAIVDPEAWAALEEQPTSRPSPVTFAVSTSKDRKWSYIGVAGTRDDGLTHLQVAKAQRGTAWVAAEVARMNDSWNPTAVAVASDDPAASLIGDLERAGVTVTTVTRQELARGCGMFVDGVTAGSIRHSGGKLLPISLGAARRQHIGRAWVWEGPKDDSTDISPLRAVTAALYVLDVPPAGPKKRPGRFRSY